jgi:hypothetical protein
MQLSSIVSPTALRRTASASVAVIEADTSTSQRHKGQESSPVAARRVASASLAVTFPSPVESPQSPSGGRVVDVAAVVVVASTQSLSLHS